MITRRKVLSLAAAAAGSAVYGVAALLPREARPRPKPTKTPTPTPSPSPTLSNDIYRDRYAA